MKAANLSSENTCLDAAVTVYRVSQPAARPAHSRPDPMLDSVTLATRRCKSPIAGFTVTPSRVFATSVRQKHRRHTEFPFPFSLLAHAGVCPHAPRIDIRICLLARGISALQYYICCSHMSVKRCGSSRPESFHDCLRPAVRLTGAVKPDRQLFMPDKHGA